jgi:hypothetical protein
VQTLVSRLLLAVLLVSAFTARPAAAYGQAPTSRCSTQGGSVIRVHLVDPEGRPLGVTANAVIVALHCGAAMGPGDIAELVAVPAGRHVVQVRALGYPPDSVQVTTRATDTILATVHLRRGYRVRHDSTSSSPPHR